MLAVFAFPAFHHCFLKLPNGTSDLKNKINSTQWGHSTHRVFPNLLSQDELIHFFASPGGRRVGSVGLGEGKIRSGSAVVTENVQSDQNKQPGPRLPSSSARGSGVSEAFGAASLHLRWAGWMEWGDGSGRSNGCCVLSEASAGGMLCEPGAGQAEAAGAFPPKLSVTLC